MVTLCGNGFAVFDGGIAVVAVKIAGVAFAAAGGFTLAKDLRILVTLCGNGFAVFDGSVAVVAVKIAGVAFAAAGSLICVDALGVVVGTISRDLCIVITGNMAQSAFLVLPAIIQAVACIIDDPLIGVLRLTLGITNVTFCIAGIVIFMLGALFCIAPLGILQIIVIAKDDDSFCLFLCAVENHRFQVIAIHKGVFADDLHAGMQQHLGQAIAPREGISFNAPHRCRNGHCLDVGVLEQMIAQHRYRVTVDGFGDDYIFRSVVISNQSCRSVGHNHIGEFLSFDLFQDLYIVGGFKSHALQGNGVYARAPFIEVALIVDQTGGVTKLIEILVAPNEFCAVSEGNLYDLGCGAVFIPLTCIPIATVWVAILTAHPAVFTRHCDHRQHGYALDASGCDDHIVFYRSAQIGKGCGVCANAPRILGLVKGAIGNLAVQLLIQLIIRACQHSTIFISNGDILRYGVVVVPIAPLNITAPAAVRALFQIDGIHGNALKGRFHDVHGSLSRYAAEANHNRMGTNPPLVIIILLIKGVYIEAGLLVNLIPGATDNRIIIIGDRDLIQIDRIVVIFVSAGFVILLVPPAVGKLIIGNGLYRDALYIGGCDGYIKGIRCAHKGNGYRMGTQAPLRIIALIRKQLGIIAGLLVDFFKSAGDGRAVLVGNGDLIGLTIVVIPVSQFTLGRIVTVIVTAGAFHKGHIRGGDALDVGFCYPNGVLCRFAHKVNGCSMLANTPLILPVLLSMKIGPPAGLPVDLFTGTADYGAIGVGNGNILGIIIVVIVFARGYPIAVFIPITDFIPLTAGVLDVGNILHHDACNGRGLDHCRNGCTCALVSNRYRVFAAYCPGRLILVVRISYAGMIAVFIHPGNILGGAVFIGNANGYTTCHLPGAVPEKSITPLAVAGIVFVVAEVLSVDDLNFLDIGLYNGN